MLENLLLRWQAMAPRERRLVMLAALLVFGYGVFALLVEPAWQSRIALGRELPQLRQQLAQVEQLAQEAQRLSQVASQRETSEAVRLKLERSIEQAGLKPYLGRLEMGDTLVELAFQGVPHAQWMGWLETVLRESRLRVVDVGLIRDPQPGRVAARLVLEMPGGRR